MGRKKKGCGCCYALFTIAALLAIAPGAALRKAAADSTFLSTLRVPR